MPTEQRSFVDRHYLLLRRLHSLSGIFPIGLFLFPHLTTNSSIMWGRWLGHSNLAVELVQIGVPVDAGVETFQHEVNFIHGLPALVLIEVFLLWLPIAFHAGLGVYFATTGSSNLQRYAYQGNWRYSLQRWTGYLGVLFIFMHLSSLRWGFTYGGLLPGFQADAAASTTARHLQDGTLGLTAAAFYLVAVLGLVFHFANGLWTAAITWGLTVSENAQRRWGWVCGGVGVALGAMAIAAVVGFATLNVEDASDIEALMRGENPIPAVVLGEQR